MPLSKIRTVDVPVYFDLSAEVNSSGHGADIGNNLEFSGVAKEYGTHTLHPYIAAMNAPLAKSLVQAYVPEGGSLCDPFCGGGGILVEGVLNGRRSHGLDVNPLAHLIAKAKTTYLPEPRLSEALGQILNLAKLPAYGEIPVISDRLNYWFQEKSMQPLAALSNAVQSIDDPECKDLFSVILSATVRDTMLTYRGEVRLRRLVGADLDRFKPDPLASFEKRAKIAVCRVSNLPPESFTDVRLGDARNTPFPDESFDAVICSPPYGDDRNGVGYFQFSRYMLAWLGWKDSDIDRQRSKTLGGVMEAQEDKLPSASINSSLDLIHRRSQSFYVKAYAFYKDYFESLREMVRISKKWMVIVVGDRILSRTEIKNGQITYEFATSLGMELDDYHKRQVPQKRIKNSGIDGGGTTEEHVLIFRKH